MSTTSGLGSNYTTNTTSNLSASSLSSHPNISSPRRYGSSSSSDENMHSLAAYHQQQLQLHRIQAVQALKACETDIYFNNYGMEQQRSAYGGSNTPELSRASPYYGNSRVPQMGLSASGHRRTLSSNYSGYSPQSYFVNHPPAIDHPVATAVSKNPFLNMANTVTAPNRTYENVPFSPNRHLYADLYDKESCVAGTLRSSLRKKKSLPVEPPEEHHARKYVELQPARESSGKDQYSFSSTGSRVRFSPRSCSPVDGKSFSSPSSS